MIKKLLDIATKRLYQERKVTAYSDRQTEFPNIADNNDHQEVANFTKSQP